MYLVGRSPLGPANLFPFYLPEVGPLPLRRCYFTWKVKFASETLTASVEKPDLASWFLGHSLARSTNILEALLTPFLYQKI